MKTLPPDFDGQSMRRVNDGGNQRLTYVASAESCYALSNPSPALKPRLS